MVTVQSQEVSSDRNTRVSGARTSRRPPTPHRRKQRSHQTSKRGRPTPHSPHPLPRDHTAHQYPAIFVNTGVNGSQPIPGKGPGKGPLRPLFPKHVARLQHGGRLPGGSTEKQPAGNQCLKIAQPMRALLSASPRSHLGLATIGNSLLLEKPGTRSPAEYCVSTDCAADHSHPTGPAP